MHRTTKLFNWIFSITLFLTVNSFAGTTYPNNILGQFNIEWIISEKPVYKSGSYYYSAAIRTIQHHLSTNFQSFESATFQRSLTIMIHNKIKLQSTVVESIIKPNIVRIHRLHYPQAKDNFHHYSLV